MSDTPTHHETGITRREALKRGLKLGGAVLWATPVVQTVGMSRALASHVSPECPCHCLKWEFDMNTPGTSRLCAGDVTVTLFGNNWTGLGTGVGNCLTCPSGGIDGGFDTSVLHVYGDPNVGFWVSFPATCQIDMSAAKCGSEGCEEDFQTGDGEDDPCFSGNKRVFIPQCSENELSISHIEIVICCDC